LPTKPTTRICLARGTAAACAFLGAAAIATSTADAAHSSRADTKAWCAAVIQANTMFGTMKNKHYVAAALNGPKAAALIGYAVRHKAQLLAATPAVIKKAQTDELTFYTHLVGSGFSPKTAMAPFTLAESKKLLDYQHAHCGITGP
jgi:hypothetical protein